MGQFQFTSYFVAPVDFVTYAPNDPEIVYYPILGAQFHPTGTHVVSESTPAYFDHQLLQILPGDTIAVTMGTISFGNWNEGMALLAAVNEATVTAPPGDIFGSHGFQVISGPPIISVGSLIHTYGSIGPGFGGQYGNLPLITGHDIGGADFGSYNTLHTADTTVWGKVLIDDVGIPYTAPTWLDLRLVPNYDNNQVLIWDHALPFDYYDPAHEANGGTIVARVTVLIDRPGVDHLDRPHRFTEEQKKTFEEQSRILDNFSRVLDGFASKNQTEIALKASNYLTSEGVEKIPGSESIGLGGSLGGSILAIAGIKEQYKDLLEDKADPTQATPNVPLVRLTLGVASAFDAVTSSILKWLAIDPPDLNFKEVFSLPAMNWDTQGVSDVDNTLVATSYHLLQDVAAMLVAQERFQGAELGGDTSSQTLQENAYNSALDAYNIDTVAMANAMKAFIAELKAAGITDADFNDNSLSQLQQYLASTGLADPFIQSLMAHGVTSDEAQQFIAAVEGLTPASTFGSAFGTLQQAVSDLLSDTITPTPPPTPLAKFGWNASVDVGGHPAGWSPAGIGDFTRDATSDLAWYNSATRDVDIWKFSNGHWAASIDVGTHPAGYTPVSFADFTHDGTSDVLWFNSTTRDVDLWKLSNGQWTDSIDIGTHPAGWTPNLTGDFNGDGTTDIAWYNSTTNDIDIWKIVNGQWAGSVDVGTHPAGWVPSLSGDFNGDGTGDIAWYNPATNGIEIWKLSNGQWAGSIDVGTHPPGYQPLGAADFNNDGTSDIAWYNPSTNDIDVWLLNSGKWAKSVDIGTHPAGSVAIGIGDFDHNGVNDILWRDASGTHIETWLLAA
jgi:hypothetical protein